VCCEPDEVAEVEGAPVSEEVGVGEGRVGGEVVVGGGGGGGGEV